MSSTGRDKSIPILVLIILVSVVASVMFWQLRKHQPDEPIHEIPLTQQDPVTVTPEPLTPPEPEPEPEPEPTVAEPSPPAPRLPTLDNSDPEVREAILKASDGGARFWLIEEHLIRKFVRLINAIEEGRLVSEYRPFVSPTSPFNARATGDDWLLDPQNYARYSPYLKSLEQLGSTRLVALYRHYLPLAEMAQQELGVDKGSFADITRRALTRLAEAESPPAQTRLSRPSVMYRFTDSDLEKRSALDKLMFRLGPEHSQRLKSLCQEILRQL